MDEVGETVTAIEEVIDEPFYLFLVAMDNDEQIAEDV